MVGFNLAQAMRAMVVGVDELAASIGVASDHLRECLRGNRRLHPTEMFFAATLLGVTVTAFFEDIDLPFAGVVH